MRHKDPSVRARSSHGVATLIALLLAVPSCRTTTLIPRSQFRGQPPPQVALVLTDETTVDLASPRVDADDMVRGGVVSCSGARCAEVENAGRASQIDIKRVPLRDVRDIGIRESDTAANWTWVGVGVVFVALIVVIAASFQVQGVSAGLGNTR